MQTVCMIACVILGLFFGMFIGYDMAFKRMAIIVDAFCTAIDHMIFNKESREEDGEE